MEGRPPEESNLVERARRGDVQAFEQIVQAHQSIAFRTAYLVTGNAADAEEAAQDAFVKAYRALGRFRAGAPFRPWLLQIVVQTNQGEVRCQDAGAFGVTGSGPVVDICTITGGTERWAGVTGHIRIHGTFTFAQGGNSKYEGEIVRP